jgi:hypothetical protein
MLACTMTNAWVDVVGKLDASTFRIRYRIKPASALDPGDWCAWLIVPVEGYLETGATGPVPMRDVEWVDIDPLEAVPQGRRALSKPVDKTESILRALRETRVKVEMASGLVRVRIET